MIVAANDKGTSGSNNLLVVVAVVEANLQKAAIERGSIVLLFEIVILSEAQLGPCGVDKGC